MTRSHAAAWLISIALAALAGCAGQALEPHRCLAQPEQWESCR